MYGCYKNIDQMKLVHLKVTLCLGVFCLKDIDKYTRHSNFSWTILSKWERRNGVNPL